MDKYGFKKIPVIAILTALSVISFLLESLMPSLFVPGAKIGLSNVFILLCLIWFSLPDALVVFGAKCLITALYGGFTQLLYSFPSGLVSLIIAYLLLRFLSGKVGVVAVCSLSAVAHNLIQLSVYSLVTGADMIFYAPLLGVAGLVAGLITGLATYYLVKYIPLDSLRKKE